MANYELGCNFDRAVNFASVSQDRRQRPCNIEIRRKANSGFLKYLDRLFLLANGIQRYANNINIATAIRCKVRCFAKLLYSGVNPVRPC